MACVLCCFILSYGWLWALRDKVYPLFLITSTSKDLHTHYIGKLLTCNMGHDLYWTTNGSIYNSWHDLTCCITVHLILDIGLSGHSEHSMGVTISLLNLLCIADIDCELEDWSEWSSCCKSCGGGEKIRTRSIIRHAWGGGQNCTLENTQIDACNTQPCGDGNYIMILLTVRRPGHSKFE